MTIKGYNPPDLARTDPNVEQFAPTDAQPIRQHARMAGDPVHSVAGGGQQWGNHGKVYHGPGAKAKAAAQGRAAYANGYRGK